jgi:hypothetical protein
LLCIIVWFAEAAPRHAGRAGAEDSDESSDDDSSEEKLVLEPLSEKDSGEEDVVGDEELNVLEPEPSRSDSETESPRKRGGASPSKKRKRIDDSSTVSAYTPAYPSFQSGRYERGRNSRFVLHRISDRIIRRCIRWRMIRF